MDTFGETRPLAVGELLLLLSLLSCNTGIGGASNPTPWPPVTCSPPHRKRALGGGDRSPGKRGGGEPPWSLPYPPSYLPSLPPSLPSAPKQLPKN